MADSTLLKLFQELVAEYDSTISTAEGSAFRKSVIDPLLNRIGDSPLDVDLETFLVDRLKVEHSDLDVSPGSGIRDLVVRPMVTMLAPLRREINSISLNQSLNNYAQMTRDEVDALLGNFFLSIQTGSLATGTVRVYFATPQATVVDSLVRFSTDDGLRFFPSSIVSVTATTMALNRDGSLYYIDVPCQAENEGTNFNISAGKITKVETIIGAVKVTNLVGFQSGVDDETKEEAITRARSSITTRTLATSRGISTLISESFASIDKIQTIGFGDPEMLRDIIEGPQEISGVPGGFEGAADADLASSVHVGGKTDVYIYQPSRVTQTLDVSNLTDVGKRVMRGSGGTSPSSGALDTFSDVNGQFLKNGVKVGDRLRFGSDTIALVDTEISSVSDTELIVTAGDVPLGITSQVYEIIRFEDTDKYVDVPLFDLVAEDSSGNPVLEGSSLDPVQPIPGDLSLSALTFGGTNQVRTTNISSENIKTPIMRSISIAELDPTQLTLTGNTYPHSDTLFAKSTTAFTGGADPIAATGSINFLAAPGATSANVNDGDYLVLEDRLGIPQTFVFKQSGGYALSSFTATPKAATGRITCCAPSFLKDGETVVLNDGTNAYTFYFDKSGTFTPATVDAYNIEVDISSATTAADVAASLNTEINSSSILITSTNSSSSIIELVHDNDGAAASQNTKITDTVASSEFVTKGMLGGAVLVSITASSTNYDVAAAFRTALLNNNLEITPGAAPVSGDAILTLTSDVAGTDGNRATIDGGSSGLEFDVIGLSGGAVGVKSSGTVRVYFGGAVGALFPANTTSSLNASTFTTSDGKVYGPTLVGKVTATKVSGSNTFTSPATSLLTRGVWVAESLTGNLLYMVSSYSSGTTTVRFDGDAGQFAYTSSGVVDYDIYQGVNYQDILVDSENGLYYVDVEVEALSVGPSYNIGTDQTLTTANVYAEGWALRNLESGSAFSTREKSFLRFSNYVNDRNLRKTSTAYAIRLSYEYADTVAEVQAFVDRDDNRIVAEDLLVKHFLPGVVGMNITLRGITSAAAQTAISSFLEGLDPSDTLEVSDLVDYLYASGATYVKLPFNVVVLNPSQDRVVTGLATEDTVPLERTRHFVLDTARLTVTVLS